METISKVSVAFMTLYAAALVGREQQLITWSLHDFNNLVYYFILSFETIGQPLFYLFDTLDHLQLLHPPIYPLFQDTRNSPNTIQ